METKKQNNVNNVNNESANVNNATANVESANDESANESANDESANVDNVDTTPTTDNTTDESKPQATAPTSEQIAAARVETKHQKEIGERYAMEAPKEVEVTKFAGAYVLGVYRPTSDRKNSDKTFYKIFYNGKIFDGYSATEFCDANGIERKHRDGAKSTPKAITMLDKLQALKAAIEAIGSEETDFVNFAKIVAKKIESEQLESERVGFVAKYAAAIALFSIISEAACARIYGADMVALAKKLGYKFTDTPTDTPTDKATDKATDTTESK